MRVGSPAGEAGLGPAARFGCDGGGEGRAVKGRGRLRSGGGSSQSVSGAVKGGGNRAVACKLNVNINERATAAAGRGRAAAARGARGATHRDPPQPRGQRDGPPPPGSSRDPPVSCSPLFLPSPPGPSVQPGHAPARPRGTPEKRGCCAARCPRGPAQPRGGAKHDDRQRERCSTGSPRTWRYPPPRSVAGRVGCNGPGGWGGARHTERPGAAGAEPGVGSCPLDAAQGTHGRSHPRFHSCHCLQHPPGTPDGWVAAGPRPAGERNGHRTPLPGPS